MEIETGGSFCGIPRATGQTEAAGSIDGRIEPWNDIPVFILTVVCGSAGASVAEAERMGRTRSFCRNPRTRGDILPGDIDKSAMAMCRDLEAIGIEPVHHGSVVALGHVAAVVAIRATEFQSTCPRLGPDGVLHLPGSEKEGVALLRLGKVCQTVLWKRSILSGEARHESGSGGGLFGRVVREERKIRVIIEDNRKAGAFGKAGVGKVVR